MGNSIPYFERPLAITDLETTGLDPRRHEIIEIGLVLVDQPSLVVIDTLDVKVQPERIEIAEARALDINGYEPADWVDAIPLEEAIDAFCQKVQDASLCGWNIASLEWPFLKAAFDCFGIKSPMDYHRMELFSYAIESLRGSGFKGSSMSKVAAFLGLGEEPKPHRAMNGARHEYRIYRKLRTWHAERTMALGPYRKEE